MTSLLHKAIPSEGRRHTVDHTARSTANTPAASRSSSVASNTSHRSEPSWFSAYDGQDTTRKGSSASIASPKSTETQKKGGGIGSWFNQDPKLKKEMKAHKELEKKKRNEQLRKDVDRMVITSKHAAAVRTKLATDPSMKRRDSGDASSTAGVVGTQNSAHMTAAQQEMRFPHSGPPALHGGQKAKEGKRLHDMPALTRIQSGDERDDEDEYQQQRREEWLSKIRPDVRMRQLSEGPVTPEDEEENVEVVGHAVQDIGGTPIIGAELEGEQYAPKPYKDRHGRAGFHKAENGVWTKPREGPYILHNV